MWCHSSRLTAHDQAALWKEDVCNKHTGQDKRILTKPSEVKCLLGVAQNPTVLSEESLQRLPVHREKKDGHLISMHRSFCLFSRGLHLHLVHVKTVGVNPQVKHRSFFFLLLCLILWQFQFKTGSVHLGQQVCVSPDFWKLPWCCCWNTSQSTSQA